MRLALPIVIAVTLVVLLVIASRGGKGRIAALDLAPSDSRPSAPALDGARQTAIERIDAGPEQQAAPSEADSERADTPAPGNRLFIGTVLEEGSLEPVTELPLELRVRFGGGAEVIRVQTDATGRFEIALPFGEYVIFNQPFGSNYALPLDPYLVEVVRGVGPLEVTLHTQQPGAVLDVVVIDHTGRPAGGVIASFSARYPSEPLIDTRVRTEGSGHARLPIWDPVDFTNGVLRAWSPDGRASDIVAVAAPLEETRYRLRIAAGGSVLVNAKAADGALRTGLRLALRHELQSITAFEGVTDAKGEHLFDGLFDGTYTLLYRDEERGYFVTWDKALKVTRGERTNAELVIEREAPEYALTGRVLDEQGQPLAGVELAAYPEPGWPDNVRSGVGGVFRVVADGADTVRVTANLSAEGDVYEPPEQVVAHGTRDVEFRRVERARVVRFDVEVVDIRTGAELEGFSATIDRGPGSERWKNAYAARRTFELHVLDATRWRIASTGYLTRTLELARAVAGLKPGERLRVALEPGLDHTFQVLDLDTDKPIAGALLRSATAGEARTDGEGRVRLQADHWSKYEVSAEGYEGESWDPEEYVLWSFGPLYLSREP